MSRKASRSNRRIPLSRSTDAPVALGRSVVPGWHYVDDLLRIDMQAVHMFTRMEDEIDRDLLPTIAILKHGAHITARMIATRSGIPPIKGPLEPESSLHNLPARHSSSQTHPVRCCLMI